jgi:Protein of unknown function (DUF2934)
VNKAAIINIGNHDELHGGQTRTDSGDVSGLPSQDEIEQRAYKIHIDHGGRHGGCELEDWLQAERELGEERRGEAGDEGRAGLAPEV